MVEILDQFMTPERILLNVTCTDWEDAIDKGAAPLIAEKVIEKSYVQAVKANHRQMPYMVIAKGIMLAHARPECGANGIGLTLMTLAKPIEFGNDLNDPVQLVITLATPDNQSHVKMLEALTNFLMEPTLLEKFLSATTVEEAISILKGDF